MNPFAYGVRAVALYNANRIDLRVEGRERLPATGPVLVAARHYHHLLDGVALVLAMPRQPHVFVALDWARSPLRRLAMETICNLAEWPIALRSDNLGPRPGAVAREEARRYARTALARANALLRRGEIVAMFPEGYPTIDPAGSRKSGDEILAFRSGIAVLAERAGRAFAGGVPVVPAGFAYRALPRDRFAITLRFGERMRVAGRPAEFAAEVRRRVCELSAP